MPTSERGIPDVSPASEELLGSDDDYLVQVAVGGDVVDQIERFSLHLILVRSSRLALLLPEDEESGGGVFRSRAGPGHGVILTRCGGIGVCLQAECLS